jgi:phospholipase C
VFDHTSVIKFLERRFADEHPGLIETNIQPWRRAVTGDLTSAFDFRTPNSMRVSLPHAASYMPTDKTNHPDLALAVPAVQSLAAQEPGVRPSRALPYDLHADGALDSAAGAFHITMSNSGRATAAFQVRSGNPADLPRCYTVEPGKKFEGLWPAAWAGQPRYDLEVHGPNGFLRAYRGASAGSSRANVQVHMRCARDDDEAAVLSLSLENRSAHAAEVRIADTYSARARTIVLRVGAKRQVEWELGRTGRWYDLIVTTATDADFRVQLAGRIENGRDSISDPALGG